MNPTLKLAARDLAGLAATNPSELVDFLDTLELELLEAAGPYARAARAFRDGLMDADRAYAEAVDRRGTWSWQERAEVEPELPLECAA